MDTDLQMWSLIVGFFLPILVALVNQQRWTDGLKSIVGFLISVIAGGGTAYFNDAFNGRSLVSTILLVTVMSIASYKGLWKPTGIAPSVEAATSRQNGR